MTMRDTNNHPLTAPHFQTNSTDHYKILQWNVRSIWPRSTDLTSVLNSYFWNLASARSKVLLSTIWFCTGGSCRRLWSLSQLPLDEPRGSDHFPVIIEHVTPSSISPTLKYQVKTLSKLMFFKTDWLLFTSYLDTLIKSFVFSDSPIDNYNCIIP